MIAVRMEDTGMYRNLTLTTTALPSAIDPIQISFSRFHAREVTVSSQQRPQTEDGHV